jgi:hypothetical protein
MHSDKFHYAVSWSLHVTPAVPDDVTCWRCCSQSGSLVSRETMGERSRYMNDHILNFFFSFLFRRLSQLKLQHLQIVRKSAIVDSERVTVLLLDYTKTYLIGLIHARWRNGL